MIPHHFGDSTEMIAPQHPMTLPELLHRIDEVQARIVAAGPLSTEAKRKLHYRLRLDWNYHSNVMEGSSLTQQETRGIMMGNVTVSGKPIKDVLEMQGHDELVTKLLGMAKGELNLSESRIREVHRAIVHEDDPTKKAQVGQWKTEANYVVNFKGERFDFRPPTEVPQAMHDLLDRTKADIERIERSAKDAPHPALLAFRFHLEYVTIHPFHDGNGRTARIFSNLLLMRFGYPPIVIRVDEKETYNRYLAEVQAYGASPDLFHAFLAERLVRSQELVLDALAGESLEEPDDLDKRLKLLAAIVEGSEGGELKRVRGRANTVALMQEWVLALMEKAIPVAQRFNPFFLINTHSVGFMNGGLALNFAEEPTAELLNKVRVDMERNEQHLERTSAFELWLNYGSFRKAPKRPFGCRYGVLVDMEDTHYYRVVVDQFNNDSGAHQQVELFKRLYHQPLTEEEQIQVVARMGKDIMDHIEHFMKLNGPSHSTK